MLQSAEDIYYDKVTLSLSCWQAFVKCLYAVTTEIHVQVEHGQMSCWWENSGKKVNKHNDVLPFAFLTLAVLVTTIDALRHFETG